MYREDKLNIGLICPIVAPTVLFASNVGGVFFKEFHFTIKLDIWRTI
jgi:hypothetical protein